ncbi:hypothetical protein KGF56_003455 [Candida oxycetoniae]|uniref:Vacuolar membrane protein n=1 Tax=Candida oxycetoniae TaxID=497107 RepID=A0AAI9WXG2_9ASCO|nr:uncharacterized protein KGF56_003455 [Candida oxycetoniae]KAI3403730.2 hypothetical protein KGF56_003455 [Candida oxycetoniae]
MVTLSYTPTHTTAPSDDDGKCELIGTFSLFTQAVLGLLCISSLIVKRFYEYPIRRTWPVWTFDVSKQLIGALGVHVFNVILSMLKTAPEVTMWMLEKRRRAGGGDDSSDNDDPCDWYFLSIVLDCTIGVYILYLVFRSITHILKSYFGVSHIDSGEYGNVNHPSFTAFCKQLAVYFSSLMITKFILYGFVEIFERQLLWITSHILLAWLDEFPEEFEILMVMFVIPIILNCLQLILIDNFIRNQMWANSNKLLKFRFPDWDDETESVRRREIEEVLQEEERIEASKNGNDLERGDTSGETSPLPHKGYGSADE